MVLNPDNIPIPVRDAPRWVSFRVFGDRKIPIAITGDEAKCNDSKTWASLGEVLAVIDKDVGHYPALALDEKYKLRFYDLDDCLGEDGTLTPLAAQVVAAANDCYIERSASGRGLHVLAWMGDAPVVNGRVCDGLEVYGMTPRFCIFTGDLYEGSSPHINTEPASLVALVQSFTGGGVGGTYTAPPRDGGRVVPTKKQAATRIQWFWRKNTVVVAGERNNTLFKFAALLQNLGYTPIDIAEELWAFNDAACQPPFNRQNPTDATEVDGIVRSAVTNVQVGVPTRNVTHNVVAGQVQPPNPQPVEPEIAARVSEIYQSGQFIDYCHNIWRTVWHGDEYILDLVLHAAACLYVANASDGINIHIAGNTQSGKSAAAKTALGFVHPTNKYTGTFSKLGLFSGLFHEKMLVFSDDTRFDDEQAGVLRGALTNWRLGSSRITMVEKKWTEVSIPPRINLVLTSVDSVSLVADDGQDESRFITVEIRRDTENLRTIQMMMQHKPPDISSDLQIVHAVWDCIQTSEVAFHRDIPPEPTIPLREWARYLDLIRAHALLSGRTTTNDEDIATVSYLVALSRRMISAEIAGLTPTERAVQHVLYERRDRGQSPMTVGEIQTAIAKPGETVCRALRGRDGSFDRPTGGLLVKDRCVQTRFDRDSRERLICAQ